MAIDILKRLESNLPAVQEEMTITVPPATPAVPDTPVVKTEKEIQDDYDFSRKTYRDLVEKSNEAMAGPNRR